MKKRNETSLVMTGDNSIDILSRDVELEIYI